MTIIKAGGTIFTGGPGRALATDAATGRRVWSARSPGAVTDLAFSQGRLLAVTDSAQVLCFAPAAR